MEYYKLEHEHEFAKNTIVVNWCLTNRCNYKCSYCPEYLHNGKADLPELETLLSFCDKVIEHYSPKNVYFEFTGGEVTYWREFVNVLYHLKSYDNVHVGVISNGSNYMTWWNNAKKYLDHACISYHPEFSDRVDYVNLLKSMSNDIRTHANIMMHPKYFDECLNVANDVVLNVPNSSIALQPLLIDFGDTLYEYTDKQKESIDNQFELYGSKVKWTKTWKVNRGAMKMLMNDGGKKVVAPHRIINDGENSWKNWKCYVGIEQIVIDVNKHIYRGWCKEDGLLGTIDTIEKFPEYPIICKRNYCHCNFDIMCTKEE